MLVINAIEYYGKIIKELDDLNEIFLYISQYAPVKEKQNFLATLLSSDGSINGNRIFYSIPKNDGTESIRKKYNDKYDEFKKNFKVKDFFGKVATSKHNINSYFDEYNHVDKSVVQLLAHLEELTDLYEKVINSNDNKKDVVVFLDRAMECSCEYEVMLDGLKCFVSTITSNYDVNDMASEKYMELQLLDVEYNVGEFGAILTNLDNAYGTIASLFNTEIKSLKIVKIESGSLFSKVQGDENILKVIALILKRISDFIHYKFTKDGKLELNSSVMKTISNDMEIVSKLENVGIDVKKAKKNIESSLNAATSELYQIASNAPKLKINNQEIVIVDTTVYLDYKTKLLETKENNSKEE